MTLTAFPLATEPVARAAGPAPLPAGFVAALEGSAARGQYLVEITAYKGGEARAGGLWTLTEGPLAAVAGGQAVTIGEVTLRFSDKHWVGEPDDVQQPNVYYEGRVIDALRLVRAMPILPEESRRAFRQFGEIALANADGAIDPIALAYAVDGRRVRVLFGPELPSAYADFRPVAEVLGTAWSGDQVELRLGLADQSYGLDTALQTTLYAGTGGAEGPAELEGKPKPLVFGRCRNVPAVLIDSANLIYQLHDGAMFAIDDVFDQGDALTASGTDVADYAALVSESPSAGTYTTALAAGLFKLGDQAAGRVTADCRGDATPDYQNTLDAICLRILEDRHGLSSMWINRASFAGAAAIAGELGIAIGVEETPTTAEVIGRLIGATAGWWGAGRDGRIRAGRLTKPEDRSPQLYLDATDIIDLRPLEAPLPRWRQRVGFKPNWTVQTEDLAASVSAARTQFLAGPRSVYSTADAGVKVRHRNALDPAPLPGLYENEADATTLADFLLALHGPDRQLLEVTLPRLAFRLDLQTVVRIVSWPAFGLQSGRNFCVVGLDERADRRGESVVATLWG